MLTTENIRARAGLVLMMAALLSGCAGARLYSETRDTQGKAAQAAWQKVDLTKMVSDDRDKLNQVLQAQLDTQDKLAAAIRNNKLRSVIEKTLNEGLASNIEDKLVLLTGLTISNRSEVIANSRETIANYKSALRQKQIYEQNITRKGMRIPNCDQVVSLETKDADLTMLKEKCADLKKNYEATFSGFKVGTISDAINQKMRDEKVLEKMQNDIAVQEEKYQKKLKAYNAAVAEVVKSGAKVAAIDAQMPTALGTADKLCPESTQEGGDAVVKAGQAGKALCDIVATIDKLNNAFSIAFISKERLDGLDKFVSIVTKANADGKLPDDASEAAKAFVLLPKLLDDARNSLAAAKKPLMLPLMIRRNMEQLKLDGANKEIKILEARVQLSNDIVETLYLQALQLWRAQKALTSDGSKNSVNMTPLLSMKMVDAFANANPDQKELLYSAASQYSDALNHLSAKHYKLEYQRIATYQEVSLLYAEVNLNQWSTIVDPEIRTMV